MHYWSAEQRLMRHEGYEPEPYLDTLGRWTIGFGSTYIFDKPVTEDTPRITKDFAKSLMRDYLYQSLINAQTVIPRFNQHSLVRREICVNMAYNLGLGGLKGFRRMREALDMRVYTLAAEEMIDSRWYHQVGARARELEAAMRTGKWP